jgi:amino acid transporter
MVFSFFQGMISYANLLLALFVLVFAIFFLKDTVHHKHRHPWIFLLCAVVVFFLLQVINVLSILGILNLNNFRFIFDLLFLGIVLFTFIFQYTLILKSEKIFIQQHQRVKRRHQKNS